MVVHTSWPLSFLFHVFITMIKANNDRLFNINTPCLRIGSVSVYFFWYSAVSRMHFIFIFTVLRKPPWNEYDRKPLALFTPLFHLLQYCFIFLLLNSFLWDTTKSLTMLYVACNQSPSTIPIFRSSLISLISFMVSFCNLLVAWTPLGLLQSLFMSTVAADISLPPPSPLHELKFWQKMLPNILIPCPTVISFNTRHCIWPCIFSGLVPGTSFDLL